MVNCVVPVSTDNPPAYNLVLVALHLGRLSDNNVCISHGLLVAALVA